MSTPPTPKSYQQALSNGFCFQRRRTLPLGCHQKGAHLVARELALEQYFSWDTCCWHCCCDTQLSAQLSAEIVEMLLFSHKVGYSGVPHPHETADGL